MFFQGSVYPLSMLVADVFMDNIEDEIVHSSPHSRCIRLWRRYADDILCVWNGTYLQANDLLRTLNNSGPSRAVGPRLITSTSKSL